MSNTHAAVAHPPAEAAATEIEVLRNDLGTALGMLARWCVAVEQSEEWDEHYTDAAYRDGPLRAMLDKAISEARALRAGMHFDGGAAQQEAERAAWERAVPAAAPQVSTVPLHLLQALRFYANGDHMDLADESAWDTVSGEPQNFWCDEAGTATIEDGSIAAMALRGQDMNWTADGGADPAPIVGEILAATRPQVAAPAQEPQQPEPNNWRLPHDLKAGHVTIRKGVHCNALVTRMEYLYRHAFPGVAELTAEQKAENLAALRAGYPLPHPAMPAQGDAREVKNKLSIDGHIDRAFRSVMESREPDATHCLLVNLAHTAVDLAFAAQGKPVNLTADEDAALTRALARSFTRLPDAAPSPASAVQPSGFIKPDNDRQVFFYEQDFYVLSNFSAFTLRWKGMRFDTSEAAYHWEKFVDSDAEVQDMILEAPSAHAAFKIAESQKVLRRRDWDDVKVDIMRDILRAKAEQHEYVRRKLLATGDREPIEDSWRDDFWGWGPNRDGQNMLGKLWMQIRAELRGSGS